MSPSERIVVVTGVLLLGAIAWTTCSDSARYQADRRMVEVSEVDNGYIVRYRTTSNPYPVREAVAKDYDEASWQVREYLKASLPETRWGK